MKHGRRVALVGTALLAVTVVGLRPWQGPATKNPLPDVVRAAPRGPLLPELFAARSRSPVAVENDRRGTRGWLIAPGTPRGVEGYAAPVSVARGDTVRLFVRTQAPALRAAIYRLGWFRGAGARLVASPGA